MDVLDRLAEERINQAERDGVFDDLPGAGQPLVLDDDRDVPPALRAGYRLLKNSGFLPPELEIRRELHSVESLLAQADLANAERDRARKRLVLLQTRLGESRLGRGLRGAGAAYESELHRRLGRRD